MNKILLAISLSLLVQLTACAGVNSKDPQEQTAAAVTQTLQANEYDKKLAATEQAQLVDVRSPGEYSEGHLKQAVNINVQGGDFATQAGKLDKKRPVFVYCHSGKRSSAAADQLEQMGFTEIYNLDGGIVSWTDAGMPTEK